VNKDVRLGVKADVPGYVSKRLEGRGTRKGGERKEKSNKATLAALEKRFESFTPVPKRSDGRTLDDIYHF